MMNKKLIPGIMILFIMVCSGFLRFYHLEKYDLWFDELGTDLYSSQQLKKMADLSGQASFSVALNNVRHDPHSAFYYLMVYLSGWEGKGLRIISAVFSLLSLVIFYGLAKLLFNERTALLAVLLMGFNAFHLWYAQEARVYALACFLTISALYAYFKALQTDQRRYWLGYSLLAILAVHASYYAIFLFALSGLFLARNGNKQQLQKWAVSFALIVVSLAAVYPILAGQLDFVKKGFWLSRPNVEIFLSTWKIFALGYTATNAQYLTGLFLFGGLAVYGAFSTYAIDKQRAVLLVSFLLGPVIFIYFLSQVSTPVYITRQFIIFSPLYYLLVAKGLDAVINNRIRLLLTSAVMLLSVTSVVNYHRGFMLSAFHNDTFFRGIVEKRNYSGLTEELKRKFLPGDLVVAADAQSFIILFANIIRDQGIPIPMSAFYYLGYPARMHPFETNFLQIERCCGKIVDEPDQKLYYFKPAYDRTLPLVTKEFDITRYPRVWMLSASWFTQDSRERNPRYVLSFLESHFDKVVSLEDAGFFLDLFVAQEGQNKGDQRHE